jgi:hypothetical protein
VLKLQTEEIFYEIVDPILDPDLINPIYIEEFEKHQSHDQSSHGNWATRDYSQIGGAGVDITKKLD